MRKRLKPILLAVIAILLPLFYSSCEYDPDGENYHNLTPLPSQIGISVNLADVEPGETIYIYGTTVFLYEIESEIGELHSVEFKYNGETVKQNGPFSGLILSPELSEADQIKDLEMEVTIMAKDKSLAGSFGYLYSAKATYKVKYVRITADDFAVKSYDIDKVVFHMVNKNENPCKYILNEKEIADLDNIVITRNDFPGYYKAKVYLCPQNAYTSNYASSNYIELIFRDKEFGVFNTSSISHYLDPAHEELYAWSIGKIMILDKQMNVISDKAIDINEIAVTPTGMVVCTQGGELVTYKDKSFSMVVSRMKNIFNNYRVTGRDQLIQGHNFQIDVFSLHTGQLVYTIDMLPDPIYGFDVSKDGKYLAVKTHDNNYIYELHDTSATLLYSFERNFWKYTFHPLNKHHLVLDNGSHGFEVLDVETQQTVFSTKGEFQNIDPVTGYLLYFDENYNFTDNCDNRFVDTSYNEIYVLNNNTKSMYGPFVLFNNFLIKNTSYIDISQNLTNK